MLEVADDLRSEARALHGMLAGLDAAAWQTPTPFQQWTPHDVVAHLHLFDRVSLLALRDPEAFDRERAALIEGMSGGRNLTQQQRDRFGALEPNELLERWHDTCHEMAIALGESDPKRRLPWFGPDMAVRTFTTARFMETWAHGQDVYDLTGTEREYTDRIRHIAVLGVKTFGWTFANRKLDPPGPAPYVRLEAPSGAVWEWNEPSETDFVAGSASDFCHVVTQGRHVSETGLEVVGEVATQWMAIAQCFAGPPTDPPQPGARTGGRR